MTGETSLAPGRITKYLTDSQAVQDWVWSSKYQKPSQAHTDETAVCKDTVAESSNPHGYHVNFYQRICISVSIENYVHKSVLCGQKQKTKLELRNL